MPSPGQSSHQAIDWYEVGLVSLGLTVPEPDRGDLAFLGPNEEPSGHRDRLCTFRAHLSGLFVLTHMQQGQWWDR